MAISQYGLARALGVPAQRVHDLVHGRWAITGESPCVFRLFSLEAQFWMNPAAPLRSRTGHTSQERIEREVALLVA